MADANIEEIQMTDIELTEYLHIEDYLAQCQSEIFQLERLKQEAVSSFFERHPRLNELVLELDSTDSEEFPTSKVENK